jgi:hypothetical protein
MADIYDMVDTWNAGATTFTAIKMNVTDTASAAGSLLIDLQLAGASLLSHTKAGVLTIRGPSAGGELVSQTTGGTQRFELRNFKAYLRGSGLYELVVSDNSVTGTGGIGFSNNTDTLDVTLRRDAADILAQRRGTNAQTKRVYGTFTDGSNGRWVELAVTTAGVASLRATGNGTGASGNVLHISSLPTSNPGPGILWNNAGTPAIGT